MLACSPPLWISVLLGGYCWAIIIGGGALLFVGAKFILKAPRASYWRSVLAMFLWILVFWVLQNLAFIPTSLISISQSSILSFVLLAGLILALLWTWMVIRWVFKISRGKSIKAWVLVLGLQFLFSIPLVASMLLYPPCRVREPAKSASSMANLSGIGKAIYFYKADNDGSYPPSFDELIESGEISEKMLRYHGVSDDEPSSYFYLPPKKAKDVTEGTLIACEKKNVNTAGRGRNVLFADGKVFFLSPENFAVELAKPQNAAFAAALKQAGGP
jgi:prepilin-type processing-associated H-X9-DG protein